MPLIVVRAKNKDDYNPLHPKLSKLSIKYDIIDILKDGVDPGKKVCLPEYLIFKVTNKTWEELQYLKERKGYYENIGKENQVFITEAKRKHQFNFDNHVSLQDMQEIKNYKDGILLKEIDIRNTEEKV